LFFMNLEKCVEMSIAVVLLAALLTPVVLAQQQALDWARYNGVPGNWNYSPQTQLNKENIKYLEIKWAFPIPPASVGDPYFSGSEGVVHTPLIYKGVAYFVTNWHRVTLLTLVQARRCGVLTCHHPRSLWTRF
jgi:glucose dehydrogenase